MELKPDVKSNTEINIPDEVTRPFMLVPNDADGPLDIDPQTQAFMDELKTEPQQGQVTDKEYAEFVRFTTELYERDQKKQDEEMERAMFPDHFDEFGRKIEVPDWWDGSPQEYQGWEDSNDRN